MKRKIPSFIKIYESLIKIPTISSENKLIDQSNKILIDLLANYLSEFNFSINIQNIPNTNKFNMISSFGVGPGGLLLSGHTDTVDYDEKTWTKDPFKLIEKNNKIYGLGTVDMKGFFAFLLDVISSMNMKKIKKPLYIVATANEETDMSGAKYFSQNTNITPDCIIIGEPTSLKLVKAHKGHISYTIDIIGDTGHSSSPNGINSIEIAYEIIKQLIDLKKYLQEKYLHKDFSIAYPTMNFGSIHGGNAVNKICSLCSITLEIRPIPKLGLKKLEILLKEKLKKIKKKWPNRIFLNNLFFPVPSYELSKKHELLIKKIENFCNIESTTVNYCTEAPFLKEIAPTLILGPGSIEQAHRPNEYLNCEFIAPTKHIIKKLITKFCY
ncbi:acetylornithine deacetylase [Buchnera aphidicola]|uniref:Acetylornithine deacetylase n=1 Tax=Buchnera aphidicola (Aphis nerii) TaxID=1241835 RepID=A0A4D6XPX5_9GAMM|nr:acetylornithine deacetylase [Buchnera aphidicola]QCI19113.1 acetylornithine deacetylase [Buchnera aphidicola (Aphis nerii)]